MRRVLVIANNLKQASYRLRIAALAEPLRRRGIELDVRLRPRAVLARRRLLKTAEKYDAVLLQRKLLDAIDARLLHSRAKRLFYDVDDAVMFTNRPEGAVSRWRTWRRFVSTARNVDHVVAGNEYVANLFRRQGARASVLPTVLDPGRYHIKEHAPTEAPTLVWIGSKSTLNYLRQLLPSLSAAAQVVPGLRLLIIADASLEGAPIPVDFVPWTQEQEADALCRGDIGIAPTPTDRWTLGKCGFKILQYMAAGLPVIASPVGANAELVVPKQTGILPESWPDWPAAIARLCADAKWRAEMGLAGRRRVEEQFSLDRAADEWARLLDA